MSNSLLTHITFRDLFAKLAEVKEIDGSRTDKLYIEMHVEALKDLITDPEMDSYISFSRPNIVDRETVERLFGTRIFTHTDELRRFVITITYRAEVLMGGKNG